MAGPQLGEDAPDVALHGLFRDVQGSCDLTVRQAVGDQPEHLAFPRREPGGRLGFIRDRQELAQRRDELIDQRPHCGGIAHDWVERGVR